MTALTPRVAIVIVTFKRQQLLSVLFDSLLKLTVAPWRVVVVDNENSAETAALARRFSQLADRTWGGCAEIAGDPCEAADANNLELFGRVAYAPQAENTGGSGGFCAGVKAAYDLGAEWFWVMDDDVAVEPEGLERLLAWTERLDVVQGSRLDYDGGPFYWQYQFITSLGIYNPAAPSGFEGTSMKPMNVMCFEGGFFKRSIVEKIGLPDRRFFIYWDDAVYGYCASHEARAALVPDVILRRTREVSNVGVGTVRQLNSTSDMTRYYIMRNRGYIARYLAVYGDYRRFSFGVGTLLTFAKELARIALVDRKSVVSGTKRLLAGWRASRKILHDASWEPMPPYHG